MLRKTQFYHSQYQYGVKFDLVEFGRAGEIS